MPKQPSYLAVVATHCCHWYIGCQGGSRWFYHSLSCRCKCQRWGIAYHNRSGIWNVTLAPRNMVCPGLKRRGEKSWEDHKNLWDQRQHTVKADRFHLLLLFLKQHNLYSYKIQTSRIYRAFLIPCQDIKYSFAYTLSLVQPKYYSNCFFLSVTIMKNYSSFFHCFHGNQWKKCYSNEWALTYLSGETLNGFLASGVQGFLVLFLSSV